MGDFTTLRRSNLCSQQSNNGDGVTIQGQEFDFKAFSFAVYHHDRADITGFKSILHHVFCHHYAVQFFDHVISSFLSALIVRQMLSSFRSPTIKHSP